ncbi:hypothetical protein AWC15_18920 [Mycobacterium lacus]|nr:hypothetical protein AWC15_18920 [Mycobacterium lacus]
MGVERVVSPRVETVVRQTDCPCGPPIIRRSPLVIEPHPHTMSQFCSSGSAHRLSASTGFAVTSSSGDTGLFGSANNSGNPGLRPRADAESPQNHGFGAILRLLAA